MSLLLYAIADAGGGLPAGACGLDGGPLRAVSLHRLAAVVGEHRSPLEPDEPTLRRYEQAVEGLMARGTVLPARFGTVLPDQPAIERMLRDRYEDLSEALRRVDGAAELGVRADWQPTTAPQPTPRGDGAGAEYMRGRLERHRRATDLAVRIDSELGELARARSCRILPRPQTAVAAAYLVETAYAGEFASRCERLAHEIAEASVVCTGPWPPYSFVGADR